MNSVKSKFNDRLEKKNSTKLGTNHMRTFKLLDASIKEKEILNSISRLKTNKASNLDGIKNEMIKSDASTFLPCLIKLFNLIFSSGFYPSSWAWDYISPAFKTGNNSKP